MQIKSFLVAVAAAAVAYAQGAADPSINTPSGVIECLPVQLTFSGTSPPFVVSIVPGGQAGAAPLKTFPPTSATAITWTVDLPASGGQYTCLIRDSLGRTNPSAPFNVIAGQPGCLAGVSSLPPAASTPAGTTPAGSTPAATSQAPQTTQQSGGTSRAASSVSAAASSIRATTSPTSGASAIHPMGIAGLLGIVGAAALF